MHCILERVAIKAVSCLFLGDKKNIPKSCQLGIFPFVCLSEAKQEDRNYANDGSQQNPTTKCVYVCYLAQPTLMCVVLFGILHTCKYVGVWGCGCVFIVWCVPLQFAGWLSIPLHLWVISLIAKHPLQVPTTAEKFNDMARVSYRKCNRLFLFYIFFLLSRTIK